jgi:hypothetical protein
MCGITSSHVGLVAISSCCAFDLDPPVTSSPFISHAGLVYTSTFTLASNCTTKLLLADATHRNPIFAVTHCALVASLRCLRINSVALHFTCCTRKPLLRLSSLLDDSQLLPTIRRPDAVFTTLRFIIPS